MAGSESQVKSPRIVLVALVLGLLYGCGGPTPPDPTPSPTDPPYVAPCKPHDSTASSLVACAQLTMKSVYSYHYAEYTPGDSDTSPVLTIEGDYEHPDRLRTRQSGGDTEIVIGSALYVRNRPGGEYGVAEYFGSWLPSGLAAFLHQAEEPDVRPVVDGDAVLDGRPCTKITLWLGQTYPKGAYTEIWVGKDTSFVLKEAEHPEGRSTPTRITVYSKFNEPVIPPIQEPSGSVRAPTACCNVLLSLLPGHGGDQ